MKAPDNRPPQSVTRRPKLTIAFLCTSAGPSGGGITPALQAIASRIAATKGFNISVLAAHDGNPADRSWGKAQLLVGKLSGPQALGYSRTLAKQLESVNPSLIHRHGLWNYSSYLTFLRSLRAGIPYIVSPHGMLNAEALKISSTRKRIQALLVERRFLNNAACVHVLSEVELSCAREYGVQTNIAVIPNGVEQPTETRQKRPPWSMDRRKVLLYLGRLHPIKNLEALLDAFKDTTRQVCGWKLVIAGFGEVDYVNRLKSQVSSLGLDSSVEFIGSVYEDRKAQALLNCDGYVLPSLSEAQPIAALESWSYACASVITSTSNMGSSEGEQAFISCEPTVGSLSIALRRFFTMSEQERQSMGETARRVSRTKYSWDTSARKFSDLYEWVTGRGHIPSFVEPGTR